MSRYLKRIALCLLICCVGAVPSFLWSRAARPNDFAVALGVGVFVVAYGIIVCSAAFDRAWASERLRRAIKTGYGVRLGACVAFPVGMAVDLFCGLVTLRVLGINPGSAGGRIDFAHSLAATVVQGLLVHVVLALFIGIVYLILSAVPRAPRPHGFDVIFRPKKPCS
jgi:hypothetical protein